MNNLKRYTLYIVNAVDITSFFIAYVLSYLIRSNFIHDFAGKLSDYNNFLLVVLIAYFIVNFLVIYKDDRFLLRNNYQEFISSVKISALVMTLVIIYLNFFKISGIYSRLFELIYFTVMVIVDFFLRSFFKKRLLSSKNSLIKPEKVLLICDPAKAAGYIHRINDSVDWRFKVEKVGTLNTRASAKDIDGIPLVKGYNRLLADQLLNEIDSVIIVPDMVNSERVASLLKDFKMHGKTAHVQVPEFDIDASFKSLDNIGDLAIVTYKDLQPMSIRQKLFKRLLDILLGLLVFPLYCVLWLVVRIFTAAESPGPVLVKRVRVGRNNRRFYQYRFRLFRTDAEKRIENGLSPYTAVGRILCALHLDGMPEILNVLAGEMSFVGPKAPSLPRYLEMHEKERSLLTVKPGIIGNWAVEKDPEKALEDEQTYIENWNVLKDLSLLIFCVLRFLTFRSLRIHGDVHMSEEIGICKSIQEFQTPIEYKKELYDGKSGLLYVAFKRVIDFVLSATGLLLLSPLFLILIVIIISDDGGTPFYTHERIGKNGKKIKVYKFRSMRKDAGKLEDLLNEEQLEQYRQEFKIENDPRITGIGSFLRKTSLDELPQIINILAGQMSIVGPRPIMKDELFKNYSGDEVAKLLSVDPGLTGYWQAYARNNAEYRDHKRQDMELYYVEHQSLFFDIKIFFKTIASVLKKEGVKS
ncbi:MAG: sugar transferase [Erysipelotrichaceae bacterium]|nr:sugar transferase [Erysipelotrichaceae bacterium]